RLERVLRRRVTKLTLTSNRTVFASWRERRQPSGERGVELRLHRHFLGAEDHVLAALADLGTGAAAARSHARAALRAWWSSLEHPEAPRTPRPARLRPRGRAHDLELLLRTVQADHFAEVAASITWSRGSGAPRRRTIRLGSWDHR